MRRIEFGYSYNNFITKYENHIFLYLKNENLVDQIKSFVFND